MVTKFADTTLVVPLNSSKAQTDIRSRDSLEKWSNLMKFKKNKCNILFLERKCPWFQLRLILPRWGGLMEKALGAGGQQAEHEPAVTVAATKAKGFLECVSRGRARDHRK